MLCLKYIVGEHTGENIESWFSQIVNSYGLADKVYRITTDNGANIKKALNFSLPGFERLYDNQDDDLDSSVVECDSD